MQVQTIRIASELSHDNSGGFIIINLADFDGAKHEPFDDEARAALSGAVAAGVIVPTMAELLVARDQLLERERELAAEKERVAEQARVNEVEAQRLYGERAAASDAATKAAVEKVAADKAAAKAADKAAGDKK